MSSATAFGFSAFGASAFGQSTSAQNLTILYERAVKQVALWYRLGSNTYYRSIVDVGSDFGPSSNPAGTVTQGANYVLIEFHREIFVLAVYLFETDEDISYLYRFPDWDVDSVYPQLGGASREWNDGDSVFSINRWHDDHPFESVDNTARAEMSFEDVPVNESPLIVSQQGGEGISLTVSEGSLET